MTTSEYGDWLRVPEAAEKLGVSAAKAYRMARAGTLPTVRIGAAWRVPASALEQYVAERTTVPAKPSHPWKRQA